MELCYGILNIDATVVESELCCAQLGSEILAKFHALGWSRYLRTFYVDAIHGGANYPRIRLELAVGSNSFTSGDEAAKSVKEMFSGFGDIRRCATLMVEYQ